MLAHGQSRQNVDLISTRQCWFRTEKKSLFFFILFKFGVTLCKAEQPLRDMELQEKEAQKD